MVIVTKTINQYKELQKKLEKGCEHALQKEENGEDKIGWRSQRVMMRTKGKYSLLEYVPEVEGNWM